MISLKCFVYLCDDGSCTTPILAGCNDATADNYNALATEDDGSCTYTVRL